MKELEGNYTLKLLCIAYININTSLQTHIDQMHNQNKATYSILSIPLCI